MKTFIISFVFIICLAGCQTSRSYEGGTYYFGWADLYKKVPSFKYPLSKEKVSQLEQEGKAYYIAEFDTHGKIISLGKRLEQKLFFKYKYYYSNGAVSRMEVTNQEGVTSSHLVDSKSKDSQQ